MLAEVDVAWIALLDPLDELEHSHRVPALGRSNEVVVADVELLPKRMVVGYHAVGQLDRQDACLRRRPFDLLAVLIGSSEEPDVVPHPAPMPGNDVRDDVLIHVPDVRVVVDVVDRGGDVELPSHEGAGL